MKTRYEVRPLSNDKFAVFRITAHYPRGVRVPGQYKNPMCGLVWIENQKKEDRDNRVAKVRDYLAERAARAPVVADPFSQLDLF